MIIGHLIIYYHPFIILYKITYKPFKSSTYIFQASPSFIFLTDARPLATSEGKTRRKSTYPRCAPVMVKSSIDV